MNSLLFLLVTVCAVSAVTMAAATGRDFDLEAQRDQRTRVSEAVSSGKGQLTFVSF